MGHKFYIPEIVYLDFFKEKRNKIESKLLDMLAQPNIQAFCSSFWDLTVIFSDIESNTEILEYTSNLELPDEKIKRLQGFFKDSFQTSFSWGHKEKEFVFIRLDRSSPLLLEENFNGMKGLLNKPVVIVFSKLDLLVGNMSSSNKSTNRVPEVKSFTEEQLEPVKCKLMNDYNDLIRYFKSETKQFNVVFSSSFAKDQKDGVRVGAKKLLGRVRFWPRVDINTPKLMGFVGYKAGMAHVFTIENRKNSPNFGQEVVRPVTILETPPMIVCAIRLYIQTYYGLRVLSEAWMSNPPKELKRVLTLPEKFDTSSSLAKLEDQVNDAKIIRIVGMMQPKLTSLSKKKPDVLEIEIGGGNSVQQRFEYAKNILGKAITPLEVFNEGQYIDSIAVTLGKGWQGPVKRWGVSILQHKGRKTKRGVATLGAWNPRRVLYSVPRAGQMGLHRRREYNKRIFKIGNDGTEITPKGGFIRYGLVSGPYLMLHGSTPGPKKRAIILRQPARVSKDAPKEPPRLTYVSTGSFETETSSSA